MRALVQRVINASVTVDDKAVGAIDSGLCVLVGITHSDTSQTVVKMANKIWNLRIFEDIDGQMNLSAAELSKELLIVSQFTLYGDAVRGRRPSFIEAARPEHAEPLIEELVEHLRTLGAIVATGKFRTEMKVSLVNDGPITLMIEI